MKKIMVAAPHADDETLGCGGTLLRHKKAGDKIHWLLATSLTEQMRRDPRTKLDRLKIIEKVKKSYRFDSLISCDWPATALDQLPKSELVHVLSQAIKKIQPEIIYLPFVGDAHSDHRILAETLMACTKAFRYPFIKRVLAYETISETDAGFPVGRAIFSPTVFVDISKYLDLKIRIMKTYKSEMGVFPFPRSEKAIRALAHVRGASSGFKAAEAFMLMRERI